MKKLRKGARGFLLDSHEYAKALEQFKLCISLLDVTIPGNFSAHSELLRDIALCYFGLNQYDACIKSCDESLAINPCYFPSTRLMGFAYSMKKDPSIPKGPVLVPGAASQIPSSSHSLGTSVLPSQSVDSVTEDLASLLLDNTQDKTTTSQP